MSHDSKYAHVWAQSLESKVAGSLKERIGDEKDHESNDVLILGHVVRIEEGIVSRRVENASITLEVKSVEDLLLCIPGRHTNVGSVQVTKEIDQCSKRHDA